MVTLVAACQPQTNIQTGLNPLKARLPSLTTNSQDQASVEETVVEAVSISISDEIQWQQVIAKTAIDVSAEPTVTTSPPSSAKTPSITDLASAAMTALDTDEIVEPPVEVIAIEPEPELDSTVSTENNSLQISGPIKTESAESVPNKPIMTLEDALADTEGAVVAIIEKNSQDQIVAIEPPKTPDPIHPKTVVGQSIDDLGAHFGLPDFERSDADVMIWQYRLAACVTDFYLYPNGDDYVVTGWAWRSPLIGQAMDEASCQQQIGNLLDANA